MLKLRHPNIIWIEGVCIDTSASSETSAWMKRQTSNLVAGSSGTGAAVKAWEDEGLANSPLILLAFMPNGDLRSLLRNARRAKEMPVWLVSSRCWWCKLTSFPTYEFLDIEHCLPFLLFFFFIHLVGCLGHGHDDLTQNPPFSQKLIIQRKKKMKKQNERNFNDSLGPPDTTRGHVCFVQILVALRLHFSTVQKRV